MPRALIFLVRVGPHEIEVELIGVHFGEKVAAAGEVFEVEKLVFFEAMHRFHVALIGVGSRWDTHMLAIAEGFREVPSELAAVVGLPDQVARRDAVAIEMLLDPGGENGAGGSAALLGETIGRRWRSYLRISGSEGVSGIHEGSHPVCHAE